MAYACTNSWGDRYYLHRKTVTLQNGQLMPVYYFAPRVKPHEAVDALPSGYRIAEKLGTRLPYLKRAT